MNHRQRLRQQRLQRPRAGDVRERLRPRSAAMDSLVRYVAMSPAFAWESVCKAVEVAMARARKAPEKSSGAES